MVSIGPPRPPAEGRESGRALPKLILAGALVALALSLLATAAGVYAIFVANNAIINNDFATDTLDPPTALTPTCAGSITLDWTATADTYASGHRVFRGTAPGGPYSQIAEVTPRTTVTYVDSPAAGTYYYVVRAFNLNWESTDGNEAIGATPGGCPVSASFVSTADTYADESKPDDNKGTATTMVVTSWQAAKDKRGFVEFDVSSIPAGSTVDSATLTLCATGVPNSTRTYNMHRLTASWVETTLTWNNQPAVAASATDSQTTPASAGCMTWTVTSDVQLWVDGTANNGWRVSDSVEGQGTKYVGTFRTREDTAVPADQPTLDVTYTAP